MKKTIGVYLDEDVYKKLAKRASDEKRPISNLVRIIIEEKVKKDNYVS